MAASPSAARWTETLPLHVALQEEKISSQEMDQLLGRDWLDPKGFETAGLKITQELLIGGEAVYTEVRRWRASTFWASTAMPFSSAS